MKPITIIYNLKTTEDMYFFNINSNVVNTEK